MTRHYSKNISPDSITGMIFAMEGIRNTVVLLNGPMGCKFYHSTTSQFLTIRPLLYLPLEEGGEKVPVDYNYLNNWFFRQQRVPCTYLDGYDYVYGTGDKVREGLKFLRDTVDFELLAIVNSPGASLIGDNLKELAAQVLPDRRCVMLESPGYSESFSAGYEAAVLELLKQVGRKLWEEQGMIWDDSVSDGFDMASDMTSDMSDKSKEEVTDFQKNLTDTLCDHDKTSGISFVQKGKQTDKSSKKQQSLKKDGQIRMCHKPDQRKKVNLLGLSIWHRYFEGDKAELIRLFDLCGIHVNCCLAADSTLEDLRHLPEADLNVVIYQEMGQECAEYLEKICGTPYYICPGPPVGFQAAETMMRDITGLIGSDPVCFEQFMEASERARALAWYKINDIYQMCGLPKGVTFAVEGDPSVVYAYSRFFMEYLGMIPDCLSMEESEIQKAQSHTDVYNTVDGSQALENVECDKKQGMDVPQNADFSKGKINDLDDSLEFGDKNSMYGGKCNSENGNAVDISALLSSLLAEYHAGHPEQKPIMDTTAELVFGNANTIAALKTTNRVFCGIEISLPGMGYTDLIPKTHLGIQGALFLTEQVLNGLMSKI